jgi:hypothetical protein
MSLSAALWLALPVAAQDCDTSSLPVGQVTGVEWMVADSTEIVIEVGNPCVDTEVGVTSAVLRLPADVVMGERPPDVRGTDLNSIQPGGLLVMRFPVPPTRGGIREQLGFNVSGNSEGVLEVRFDLLTRDLVTPAGFIELRPVAPIWIVGAGAILGVLAGLAFLLAGRRLGRIEALATERAGWWEALLSIGIALVLVLVHRFMTAPARTGLLFNIGEVFQYLRADDLSDGVLLGLVYCGLQFGILKVAEHGKDAKRKPRRRRRRVVKEAPPASGPSDANLAARHEPHQGSAAPDLMGGTDHRADGPGENAPVPAPDPPSPGDS